MFYSQTKVLLTLSIIEFFPTHVRGAYNASQITHIESGIKRNLYMHIAYPLLQISFGVARPEKASDFDLLNTKSKFLPVISRGGCDFPKGGRGSN